MKKLLIGSLFIFSIIMLPSMSGAQSISCDSLRAAGMSNSEMSIFLSLSGSSNNCSSESEVEVRELTDLLISETYNATRELESVDVPGYIERLDAMMGLYKLSDNLVNKLTASISTRTYEQAKSETTGLSLLSGLVSKYQNNRLIFPILQQFATRKLTTIRSNLQQFNSNLPDQSDLSVDSDSKITSVTTTNSAPTFANSTKLSFTTERQSHEVNIFDEIEAKDADRDPLTLSAFDLTYATNRQNINYRFDQYGELWFAFQSEGVYGFSFTISDGTVSKNGYLTVNVTKKNVTTSNSAPTFTSPAKLSFTTERQSHEVNIFDEINAKDADRDTLTLSDFELSNSSNSRSVDFRFDQYGELWFAFQSTGEYLFLFEISDGTVTREGSLVVDVKKKNVTTTNSAPTFANSTKLSFTTERQSHEVNIFDEIEAKDADRDPLTLSAFDLTYATNRQNINYRFDQYGELWFAFQSEGVYGFSFTISDGTVSKNGYLTVNVKDNVERPTTDPVIGDTPVINIRSRSGQSTTTLRLQMLLRLAEMFRQ